MSRFLNFGFLALGALVAFWVFLKAATVKHKHGLTVMELVIYAVSAFERWVIGFRMFLDIGLKEYRVVRKEYAVELKSKEERVRQEGGKAVSAPSAPETGMVLLPAHLIEEEEKDYALLCKQEEEEDYTLL